MPSGLRLRGYVDRLDVNAAGDVRVVDYKTGRAPREAFEAKALFQMKFYALVLWRVRGVVPRLLQLMYLGDREILRYSPDEGDLLATERKLEALWTAIERALAEGEFLPRRSRRCAGGATTRRCARSSGARRRRCRPPRRPTRPRRRAAARTPRLSRSRSGPSRSSPARSG